LSDSDRPWRPPSRPPQPRGGRGAGAPGPGYRPPLPGERPPPPAPRGGYRPRSRWYPFIPTLLVVMLIVAIAELLLPSDHPQVSALGANLTKEAKTAKPTPGSHGHSGHTTHGSKPTPTPSRGHGGHATHGTSVRLPDSKRSPTPPPPPPPSPSPSPPPPLSPTTQSLTVGTLARSYQVYAAANISGKVPAFIVLSGVNASLATEEGRDGLIPFAQAGQLVLVYPVDIQESWNAGFCCGAAQARNINDIGFIDALVGALQAQPEVGPIYLIGYSNGGKLAYDVVCSNPALVKGFAVIAATPTSNCPAGAPVSFLAMDGTNDTIEAYNASSPQHSSDGFQEVPVVDEVNWWAKRDECSAHNRQTMGSLVLDAWSSCSSGTVVQLGSVLGGGHEWSQGGGPTPSAADLLWAFFTQTIPAASAPPPAPPAGSA
jgi:polyhydroxybutyrate depolymerase